MRIKKSLSELKKFATDHPIDTTIIAFATIVTIILIAKRDKDDQLAYIPGASVREMLDGKVVNLRSNRGTFHMIHESSVPQ